MADYAPPAGPPPPKVPEGWKAQFNQQYNEWFYVNTYTKQSQWDKPTEPVYPPPDGRAPDGPPPSYQPGANAPNVSDTKPPVGGALPGESDAAMAARLQAEESARGHGGSHSSTPGSSSDYYNQGGSQQGYPQQGYDGQSPYGMQGQEAQRSKSGGLLGKLLGKGKQAMASQGGGGHGGFSQHGYGGHQQSYGHGYGGYPQQGGYGGYPPHGGGYGQMPQKKHGGMGAGGAAALGLGGGLLGGMLIGDAIADSQQDAYQDGFQDGGGDMGDMGGGDF